MRLAYADPPYPGRAHLYPENTEVDHVDLIARLAEYDGWALSTDENTLQYVLGICPPDVRILAWCKTNSPPFGSHPIASWEPVICAPARSESPIVKTRSHIATPKPGGAADEILPFPGVKPPAFCEWVIRCLGAETDDTLEDLFPGTGTMARAWMTFQSQPALWKPNSTGRSRADRERIRSSQIGPGGLLRDR